MHLVFLVDSICFEQSHVDEAYEVSLDTGFVKDLDHVLGSCYSEIVQEGRIQVVEQDCIKSEDVEANPVYDCLQTDSVFFR